MSCFWIGIFILLSAMLAIDYAEFRNGGNAWFFADVTEIEIINREIALLEAKEKLQELRTKQEEVNNDQP